MIRLLLLSAATIGGIIFLRSLIVAANKEISEEEENWAIQQFARIVATRTNQSEKLVFESLKKGEKLVLPSYFKQAILQYELISSDQEQKGIEKKLIVLFTDEEISAKTTMKWIELPAEIRSEIIKTGHAVQRDFSFA
jgi:MarR-like DNA-binding transcriptional regulator SgrR of sgrS sRNA